MIDTRPEDMSWRYQTKRDIKPSASRCRCLLGALDHEQAAVDFKREMDRQQKEDSEKYDFDFVKSKPLPRPARRYDWQAYTETQPELSISHDNADVTTNPTVGCLTPSKNTTKRGISQSPSTQRTVPEFFPKRKRLTPSTKDSSPKRLNLRQTLTPKIRAPLFREHSSSDSTPSSSP